MWSWLEFKTSIVFVDLREFYSLFVNFIYFFQANFFSVCPFYFPIVNSIYLCFFLQFYFPFVISIDFFLANVFSNCQFGFSIVNFISSYGSHLAYSKTKSCIKRCLEYDDMYHYFLVILFSLLYQNKLYLKNENIFPIIYSMIKISLD